ncbi:hypothetical protein F4782DRAFT_548026 [Xylaria castorea]|nr:hypothetical protein F4782DRAFT_548026 [Xylaria castorea]
MLSLSSLLNPSPPGSSIGNRFPPSPESSSPTDSCVEDSVFLGRPTMPKQKVPKDAAVFTKSKPKGAINFQPYEDLDEISLHRVRKFQVYPLGKIREYSRHIPYNSGKKDFFEKTGRESFEVFQYVFKVPGDDAEYAVMWDYNIGLVRMTPFFKCCKYPKTTPAKMLNSNPGLKEITHSITGGSIMAQGYWMPYQCAKAVCATFCHNISWAMIPIFGTDFPALCIQVDAPEYSRMVIDPEIVIRSTREAEYYRHLYRNTASDNASPKRDRRAFHSLYDESSRHRPQCRIRKTYISTPGSENSPYTTDTDGEASPVTERINLARDSPHPQFSRFPHSPIPSMITPLRSGHTSSGSSGWTPVNVPHPPGHLRPHAEDHISGPSPWLTAIPRFTTTAHLKASSYPNANVQKPPRSQPYPTTLSFSELHSQMSHPRTAHRQLPSPSDAPPHLSQRILLHQPPRAKRSAAQIEEDVSTDHQHSRIPLRHGQIPQGHHTDKENHAETQPINWRGGDRVSGGSNAGADKRAALLLMNLSVRDRSLWMSPRACRETDGPNTSRVHDAVVGRYSGNDTIHRANVDSPDGDGSSRSGHINYHYQAGAGTMVRIGGDGVSSEMTSPSNGAFPRIKRVRSNSM